MAPQRVLAADCDGLLEVAVLVGADEEDWIERVARRVVVALRVRRAQYEAHGARRRSEAVAVVDDLQDLMREALKMQSEAIRARGGGPDEGGTQDAIRGYQSSRRRT